MYILRFLFGSYVRYYKTSILYILFSDFLSFYSFFQISKIDIKTKSRVLWGSESGSCYPSEPVFVPNPNGVDEDDGNNQSFIDLNSKVLFKI